MRTLEELQKRLESYQGVEYLYYPNIGHIAWHVGTGENIEVLFLEAMLGYGAVMYARMIRFFQENERRPYSSLYAFRRSDNEVAARFYSRLGWQQRDLGWSIYGGAETTIMWTKWEDLIQVLAKYHLLDQ